MKNIVRFFSEHQDKIILVIGAILIAAIGFAAGRLATSNSLPEPIVIEEPEQSLQHAQEEGSVLGSEMEKEQTVEKVEENIEKSSEAGLQEAESNEADLKKGRYVGSKSGKKYHYPGCRYGKKIKEENLIRFSSAKEAQKAGYEPCKVCKPPTD